MTDIKQSLSSCILFDKMDKEVVSEILASSQRGKYSTGDLLIEKGSVPKALFIIESGTVGIYNEDVLLVRLSELSILGESFLADASATATIVALTELKTVEIKTDHFYNLAVKYPQLIFNLFAINHQRLRNSNESALKEAHAREEKLALLVKERTAELNKTLEDLVKTNSELEETRDSLIETQKFRQQFLANMSHEIRTPMNAIVGLTNLLLKSKLDAQQDKYLNVIKKSGANLLVIINDILDLAKIESGKMELEKVPFPLVAAIKNIHTILNLKAEDVTLESKIEDKCRVKFSVKDTGIGIPEDKIDKIFESFGQASADTTRKFGGTGLGLTISKQLVEMHGGEVKVKSVVGEGSDFYFIIDYSQTIKPVEENIDDSAAGHNMKGKKILLVEDNEFNQLVAVDTINDLFPDVIVEVAENGIEALKKLESNEYSFVFMDIQMPEMDGYETTRQIRKLKGEKGHIRICAMTANVTKDEIDACLASGMNDYMMKPFTHEILKEKILKNTFVHA